MTAAIYARYSSDLQSERSIDDQVAACRLFAERAGIAGPFGIYADQALSGASMATRPQLQALLAEVRGRRVSVIIAESIDRLSRDQADVHLIRRATLTNGARLFTIADGEVTAMVAGLKGIIAEHFLIDLAQKTRRGLMGVARSGRCAGGRCYGYALVDGAPGVRAIVAAEADIIGRIFREYVAEGRTPRAIAHRLNADGVPGPSGGLWRPTALNGDPRARDGLLRQELYRGRIVFNRRRFIKDPETGRRRAVLNPESEWLTVEVPELRIVDEALWLGAQARRRVLAAVPAFRDRRAPKRLLSGLARCGVCGSAMTIINRRAYGCAAARDMGTCAQRRSIHAENLDARVLAGLKRVLLAPDLVAEAVRAYHEELQVIRAEQRRRRHDVERDLAEARRRAERIVGLLIETKEKSPTALAKLAETESIVARLEAELAQAAPPSVVEMHPHAADLYRARILDLEQALARPESAPDTLAAVRDLIDSVAIRPDEAEPDGWAVTVNGQLAAILTLGFDPSRPNAPPSIRPGGTLELGAGGRSGLGRAVIPFAA